MTQVRAGSVRAGQTSWGVAGPLLLRALNDGPCGPQHDFLAR